MRISNRSDTLNGELGARTYIIDAASVDDKGNIVLGSAEHP